MSIKNSVVFVCLLVSFAGCASVAPGIQFSKSRADVAGDDDHPRTEIISINSALVRKEKELRDRQVADDLSSLVSPPQPYVVEAGDVLQIVVWDHPELSASMLPAPAFGVQGVSRTRTAYSVSDEYSWVMSRMFRVALLN